MRRSVARRGVTKAVERAGLACFEEDGEGAAVGEVFRFEGEPVGAVEGEGGISTT